METAPEEFILHPGASKDGVRRWRGRRRSDGAVLRLMQERNKITYNLSVPLSNRARQILQPLLKYMSRPRRADRGKCVQTTSVGFLIAQL